MEVIFPTSSFSNTVSLLGFICSCLSLIGALFTGLSYLCSPNVRKNFFYYLVFHLAISDLGVSITGLYTVPPTEIDPSLCTIMATMRSFSVMSSFILNLSIALFLYSAVRNDKNQEDFFKEKNTFLAVNYGFAVFGAIGPLLSNAYGPSTIYCWIDSSSTSITAKFWLIVEAYITLPIVLVWVVILYFWIIKKMKSTRNEEKYTNIYRLTIIPVIFFFCNFGTMLDFFVKSSFLRIAHICLRQLQGSIHALLYGFMIIKDKANQKLVVDEAVSMQQTILES